VGHWHAKILAAIQTHTNFFFQIYWYCIVSSQYTNTFDDFPNPNGATALITQGNVKHETTCHVHAQISLAYIWPSGRSTVLVRLGYHCAFHMSPSPFHVFSLLLSILLLVRTVYSRVARFQRPYGHHFRRSIAWLGESYAWLDHKQNYKFAA
jgi:hypothetical protein